MKNRKWLKIILIAFGTLALLAIAAFFYFNKPVPEGKPGADADAFATAMLEAVHHDAWQKTGAIRWTFAGRRSLLWDKERHFTRVRWNENEVFLDIDERVGTAYAEGAEMTGEKAKELLDEAWKIWVNDAFWLNPVSKVFDSGTSRELVDLENGNQGLKITYDSGGDTPGDSYLWEVGPDYVPLNWKMWVSIIPVGGTEASWEKWITLSTGAKISTFHKMAAFDLELTEIKAANTLLALEGTDIFEGKIN